MRLPLVGDIAAGSPLLAEQNVEDYLTFPGSTRGDFLLRVRGESMIEAGILDGDLVIVPAGQEARNGEIVVALVGDDESAEEATVKTFYREGTGSACSPRTPLSSRSTPTRRSSSGRVVGVFREL